MQSNTKMEICKKRYTATMPMKILPTSFLVTASGIQSEQHKRVHRMNMIATSLNISIIFARFEMNGLAVKMKLIMVREIAYQMAIYPKTKSYMQIQLKTSKILLRKYIVGMNSIAHFLVLKFVLKPSRKSPYRILNYSLFQFCTLRT